MSNKIGVFETLTFFIGTVQKTHNNVLVPKFAQLSINTLRASKNSSDTVAQFISPLLGFAIMLLFQQFKE